MTDYHFRHVNDALPALAHLILEHGHDVPSRVGATKEKTFQHFTILDPLQREIVVEGRKANIAAQIAETMWVLAGRNDVEWLEAYLPRAADFSDDGKTWRAGYGPRLRAWVGEDDRFSTDQLAAVIRLLSEDPGTRRAVMSIFDPSTDYGDSKDIPCNNWLHFLARDNVLDLHVAIRSNDLVWGWSGINQFEWSVLLEIVAHYAGLEVGSIHYAISSLHIYDRHWEKAEGWKVRTVHTQRDRRFEPESGLDWDTLCSAWFKLEQRIRVVGVEQGGHRHLTGSCPICRLMADVAGFPDPMLRAWLNVLGWWWSGNDEWLTPVQDSRLWHAAQVGTGPRKVPGVAAAPTPATPATRPQAQRAHPSNAGRFVAEVTRLHNEKDEAYGTSWKKRGELFSILPNIARKADRLGAGDTTDENQTDTAVDLMVYLAKYRTFLDDVAGDDFFADSSDTTTAANNLIARMVERVVLLAQPETTVELEDQLRAGVDEMMDLARKEEPDRAQVVERLHEKATILAMRRWRETPALFARPVGEDDYRGADHD